MGLINLLLEPYGNSLKTDGFWNLIISIALKQSHRSEGFTKVALTIFVCSRYVITRDDKKLQRAYPFISAESSIKVLNLQLEAISQIPIIVILFGFYCSFFMSAIKLEYYWQANTELENVMCSNGKINVTLHFMTISYSSHEAIGQYNYN